MLLRPGQGTLIAQLGDAFALFNCEGQRLYEVDGLAAWAWQHAISATAGIPRRHLSAQMSAEFKLASVDVEVLLDRYVELGILHACTDLTSSFVVRLNDSRWLIECPEILCGLLEELFRGIVVPMHPRLRHGYLCILIDSDRYELIADGQSQGIFNQAQIVPAVKVFLTDALLQTNFTLALHAALLRCGNRQLLIAGASGAGKTTLALALAAGSGCSMLGDDIVMLADTGRLRGVPFPIAVKDGSWELLRDFYPQLAARPVTIRSDGKIVKFLPGEAEVNPSSSLLATTMIFIRQNSAGRSSLSRMPALTAFQRLLGEAASPTHKLTDRAFRVLSQFVNRSQAFEMDVGLLEDAVGIVRDL